MTEKLVNIYAHFKALQHVNGFTCSVACLGAVKCSSSFVDREKVLKLSANVLIY